MSRDIARVVNDVKDSVVTIISQIPHPLSIFGYEAVKSYGSGFIISPGFIVTNAHVIRVAATVNVMFSDGFMDQARPMAIDATRDLALLETHEYGKPIKLGDSSKVELGEIVLAIGSPLGLPGPSVTMGIISAVGRTIMSEEIILEDLIQTDAAINPGNSGGPLVNLNGEAIGVTTAIIPFAQGIGFAIPINTVRRFIEMLEKYGRPLRAWIGVYVAPLNPSISSIYQIPVKEGLLVLKVIPGSPAYRSGIREGDIIVKANNRPLRRTSELRETIEESIERGYVVLEIIRGGTKRVIEVEIIVEEL